MKKNAGLKANQELSKHTHTHTDEHTHADEHTPGSVELTGLQPRRSKETQQHTPKLFLVVRGKLFTES